MESRPPIPDYYGILGVAQSASVEEIKTAYRRLASRNHPDRGGSHQRMVQINEAWEVLSNSVTRAAYDQVWNAAQAAWSPEAEVEQRPEKDTGFVGGHPYWRQAQDVWPAVVKDFAEAKYERATVLFWSIPEVRGSQSGQAFVAIGGLAAAGLYWLMGEPARIRLAPHVGTCFGTMFVMVIGAYVGSWGHRAVSSLLRHLPLTKSEPPSSEPAQSSEAHIVTCPGNGCSQRLRVCLPLKSTFLRCPKCGLHFQYDNPE